MNANRLINMAFRMLMRHGMKYLSKGQKQVPNSKAAQKAARVVQRGNRL